MSRHLLLWAFATQLRFLRLDKMWWSLNPHITDPDWLHLRDFRS